MLPGVETCRNCHAPARSEKGVLTAGARYECTECHLYHHPESASPATSAGARPGETALDLRRFLESVRD
jgi:transposase-like protein